MIPLFDKDGDLPPGIHSASWDEFQSRFCVFARTDQRIRLGERIEELIAAARASGIVERVVFGGSFVTAVEQPNDFDVIVVFRADVDVATLRPYQLDLVDGDRARRRFRGDIFPARNGASRASKLLAFFQQNRLGKPVGVVEVLL